jgi:phenylacetate-CoA ligase
MEENRKFWNEDVETLSPQDMKALQWNRLKKQLHYNFNNSVYYREEKFHKAGLTPEDVQTFEDFQKIPLLTKDEHRQIQADSIQQFGHPYGLITCASREKIVRINSTSGTTGQPTLYTLTQNDINVLNEMHCRKYWRTGLRPGHIVLQALSLSMLEGGTQRVLDFTLLTKPDVLIATPSFGEYLIEQTPRLIGKDARELGIRWFYCAGEPGAGIPSLRKKLQEGFGAKVFDHTGGGHAFHGISCETETYPGMHFVSADHCILELVDPETKEPIEITNGAMGEMVFTFIGWEGGPFMRYALGDLIQIFTETCNCGWPEMRFKILGRADDMLIIKGVNLYPSALKGVVSEFEPRTTGALRIILEKSGPLVKAPLKIRIEHGLSNPSEEDKHQLMTELNELIKNRLRIRPDIELVEPFSLPRESGKTSLIEIKK